MPYMLRPTGLLALDRIAVKPAPARIFRDSFRNSTQLCVSLWYSDKRDRVIFSTSPANGLYGRFPFAAASVCLAVPSLILGIAHVRQPSPRQRSAEKRQS